MKLFVSNKFSGFSSRRAIVAGAAFCLTLGATAHAGEASGAIIPKTENGRTVWVNNESYVAPGTVANGDEAQPQLNTKKLIYWSRTERRWKRVPKPSAYAVKQARSAAQEVNSAIEAAPLATKPASLKDSPDTRILTSGRNIDQTQMDAIIVAAASRHGVDPNLVRAIIKQESGFNPRARSRKGAIGLMQLMPATARDLKVNPYDPVQNVEGGVRHFKGLLENFNGDLKLSLAAYNAGQGAVERNKGIPPYRETRDYVRRITAAYGANAESKVELRPAPIRVNRDADGRMIFTND